MFIPDQLEKKIILQNFFFKNKDMQHSIPAAFIPTEENFIIHKRHMTERGSLFGLNHVPTKFINYNGYIIRNNRTADLALGNAAAYELDKEKRRILILGLGHHEVLKQVFEALKKSQRRGFQIDVIDNFSLFHKSKKFKDIIAKENSFNWNMSYNIDLIDDDVFQFLMDKNAKTYDFIIWNLTCPVFWSAAHIYTEEFFDLIRTRLSDSGKFLRVALGNLNFDCLQFLTFEHNRVTPDYKIYSILVSEKKQNPGRSVSGYHRVDRQICNGIETPTLSLPFGLWDTSNMYHVHNTKDYIYFKNNYSNLKNFSLLLSHAPSDENFILTAFIPLSGEFYRAGNNVLRGLKLASHKKRELNLAIFDSFSNDNYSLKHSFFRKTGRHKKTFFPILQSREIYHKKVPIINKRKGINSPIFAPFRQEDLNGNYFIYHPSLEHPVSSFIKNVSTRMKKLKAIDIITGKNFLFKEIYHEKIAGFAEKLNLKINHVETSNDAAIFLISDSCEIDDVARFSKATWKLFIISPDAGVPAKLDIPPNSFLWSAWHPGASRESCSFAKEYQKMFFELPSAVSYWSWLWAQNKTPSDESMFFHSNTEQPYCLPETDIVASFKFSRGLRNIFYIFEKYYKTGLNMLIFDSAGKPNKSLQQTIHGFKSLSENGILLAPAGSKGSDLYSNYLKNHSGVRSKILIQQVTASTELNRSHDRVFSVFIPPENYLNGVIEALISEKGRPENIYVNVNSKFSYLKEIAASLQNKLVELKLPEAKTLDKSRMKYSPNDWLFYIDYSLTHYRKDPDYPTTPTKIYVYGQYVQPLPPNSFQILFWHPEIKFLNHGKLTSCNLYKMYNEEFSGTEFDFHHLFQFATLEVAQVLIRDPDSREIPTVTGKVSWDKSGIRRNIKPLILKVDKDNKTDLIFDKTIYQKCE